MKRRAGIAQAMLNDPKILILDEPTAGLDPNERIRFRNLISKLSEEHLVLLSTHIVSDIEYIANEIWMMKDGAVVNKGTLDEIINTMPEKVWNCFVPQQAVSSITKRYKVSNIKSGNHGVDLRIISAEKPCETAVCVTEFEEYQEHIQYTHNAFCRIVIRHASIDAARKLYSKWKREISLEYLSEEKFMPSAAAG